MACTACNKSTTIEFYVSFEGNENASLFANSMFVNPEKGDFEFKEGSPALELGIEELDVSRMGLIDNHK